MRQCFTLYICLSLLCGCFLFCCGHFVPVSSQNASLGGGFMCPCGNLGCFLCLHSHFSSLCGRCLSFCGCFESLPVHFVSRYDQCSSPWDHFLDILWLFSILFFNVSLCGCLCLSVIIFVSLTSFCVLVVFFRLFVVILYLCSRCVSLYGCFQL